MAESDKQNVLAQLEEKMLAELRDGHPYEALQYVQSFVARKKKVVGQNTTSALVFRGVNLLVKNNASSSAGTLLTWFIEEGAGLENAFKLQKNPLDSENYCDVQRLIDALSSFSVEEAAPIVDLIYAPFHLVAVNAKVPEKSALATRIYNLEVVFANIFDGSKRWLNAFKCYVRLGEIKKASNVVDKWSAEGYATERALFFARAGMQLLADGKVKYANEFMKHSAPLITENANTPGGGPNSAGLAVWHLFCILTDLAFMPPAPRVDKPKLYGILYNRYMPLLVEVDSKLADLLVKTGENSFNIELKPANPQPNPMAMLQGLLNGGAGGAGGSGKSGKGQQRGPDLNAMMQMMNQMQGKF